MLTQAKPIKDETRLVPVQIQSESSNKPPLIKKYSRASVGRMLEPKVSQPTAAKYHRLAIAYVPSYRQAFEYQWGQETKTDETALIPETHIRVLQRIRTEYQREGEHRPTDDYIVEWLQHPDTQDELNNLLKPIDPIIALLYQE